MITLLSLETEITKDQCFKHLEFPFNIAKECSKLLIKYSYSPKEYVGNNDLTLALCAFQEAYDKSKVEISEVKKELPLKNHITISLSKEGDLIGTAHRHSNDMVIEVSKERSTPGFYPIKITAGEYAIVLSVHALLSDRVYTKIDVVGYE